MTTKSRESEIRVPTMFYANPVGSKSEVAECCLASDVVLMREKYIETLEEIDSLAEGGLCQYSTGGKHAFLNDIRHVIAKLNIQGGITPYKS